MSKLYIPNPENPVDMAVLGRYSQLKNQESKKVYEAMQNAMANIITPVDVSFESKPITYTNQNILYSNYVKQTYKVEKEAKGLIQPQMNNGVLTGVKVNIFDTVKLGIGFEDWNIKANASVSGFGHTVGIEGALGADGLGVSAGVDNGKKGYDIGANLNLDIDKGVLGLYAKDNVITNNKGVTMTTSTEAGFRVGNGPQLLTGGAIVGVGVTVPSLLPASLAGGAASLIINNNNP